MTQPVTTPLRPYQYLVLNEVVSWDLFTSKPQSWYRLLDPKGNYVLDRASGEIVTMDDWAETVRLAFFYGAPHIVNFKQQKVYFAVPSGRSAWWFPAIVIPHPALEAVNSWARPTVAGGSDAN